MEKEIYILLEIFDNGVWNDYNEDIIGIFDNLELAEKHKKEFEEKAIRRKDRYDYYIDTYELNKIKGEM